MTTKLLYLTDSYKKSCSAKIISLVESGDQVKILLDQTIFYPQGGGQPSDTGLIANSHGQAIVSQVVYAKDEPLHIAKLQGSLKPGDRVTLNLDWDRRYPHMQQHTAGHILDEAVKSLFPDIYGVAGCHGIGGLYYIKFQGLVEEASKSKILQSINAIRASDETITSNLLTYPEIEKLGIRLPFKLPENKPLRVVSFGSRLPVPDGGTQLRSTGELWPITLGNFIYEAGLTTIHYQTTPPKAKALHPSTAQTSLNLSEFTALNHALLKQAEAEKIWNQACVTKYLGKKGLFNLQLAGQIRFLSAKDKPTGGQILNQTKAKLLVLSSSSQSAQENQSFLDLTQPGDLPPLGHLHPISSAIHEITQIFRSIGFTRVRYPEVDYDHYVFESLNMPPNHPARDEWETFFINAPAHPTKGGLVLTTHTSNGQVREMERVGHPPIRMLNLGKCYRRQQDVTHTAMFHQFEGLVIDQGINIQHLKGTLDFFARKFYGHGAVSRIRPFMFKFTEPSFEVDFSCTQCAGTGLVNDQKCRFCKSGWHEVGGAGMVHPNVLRAGGIDPQKYQGFAFGWGVERVYTLKPGLHLDDIRPLYSTNLQFLNQF